MTEPGHRIVQNVYAFGGFAYGAIYGDVHVHGDGSPVYVLEEHRPRVGTPDPSWLGQPSRLLDARNAIVPFTGRDAELDELTRWREDDAELAVRWLHAPGGQGKTRLAEHFATVSAEAGWKTVIARHGGAVRPESQGSHDTLPGDRQGLLVLVDYADRWPLHHLSWLLANSLFNQRVPVRVLLLARTAHAWPAVQGHLSDRAATSDQPLAPLTKSIDRSRMFAAARACFSALYGRPDAEDLAPPAFLDQPDYGLILCLHMAALAAVDAHVQGRPAPDSGDRLSAYLLRREWEQWQRLHEGRATGLNFQTTPDQMHWMVFAATLAGAQPWTEAVAVLDRVGVTGPQAAVALQDHARCYPATEPGTVLEPLYPDRLAEDFLALSLPGHPVTGHPSQPWALHAVNGLLASAAPPAFAQRAVIFLSATGARWPHVVRGCLNPLLQHHPGLALHAGNAALTVLADLASIDIDVLSAIETVARSGAVPAGLDTGLAAVAERVRRHRMDSMSARERAEHYQELIGRLARGEISTQAFLTQGRQAPPDDLAASQEVVDVYRRLAANDPVQQLPQLVRELRKVCDILTRRHQVDEALPVNEELVDAARQLAQHSPEEHLATLAEVLDESAIRLARAGRWAESLAHTEESVTTYRWAVESDPWTQARAYTKAVDTLANLLSTFGRTDDAVAAVEEALALVRRLVQDNSGASYFRLLLAPLCRQLGRLRSDQGRSADAIALGEEAVSLNRELLEEDAAPGTRGGGSDLYLSRLAESLDSLGIVLARSGRRDEAVSKTREAVDTWRRLAEARPAHRVQLADSLFELGRQLQNVRQHREAEDALRETVQIQRGLAAADPARRHHFALALLLFSTTPGVGSPADDKADAAHECLALWRQLAEEDPARYLPELAGSLVGLSDGCLPKEQAVAALDEAIGIYGRLAEQDPAEYLSYLEEARAMRAALGAEPSGAPAQPPEAATEAVNLKSQFGQDVQRARDLLRPLAYAEGHGLPSEDIWASLASRIADTDYRDEDLVWLRRNAGSYVIEAADGDRTVHRLNNQALADDLRSGIDELATQHAFVQVLVSHVPLADGGVRDWSRAHPYTLRHLATHAAKCGVLDQVIADVEYLVHAHPDELLVAMRGLTTDDGRLTAAVYRASVGAHRHLPPASRRQVLVTDAARFNATHLWHTLAMSLEWTPRWASGAQVSTALRDTLTGHQGTVNAVACAHVAGRAVAISGGDDGTVRVWDLATGAPVARLSEHLRGVKSIACTAVNGRPTAITLGSADGNPILEDLTTGNALHHLTSEGTYVNAMTCVDVGGWPVAVMGVEDGTIRAVDVTTRTLRATLPRWEFPLTALTHADVNGRLLVLGIGPSGKVTVWDVAAGSRLATVDHGDTPVLAVACTTVDGQPIAVTGGDDGTVRLWDLATSTQLAALTGNLAVHAVACTTVDGRAVVVSGGVDATVRVWDLATSTLRAAFTGHLEPVTATACTTVDGQSIAVTGSEDGTVRTWNLSTLATAQPAPTAHAGDIVDVAWCEVGNRPVAVTAAEDATARVWDLTTGAVFGTLTGYAGPVSAVACASVDGRPVAVTAGFDTTVWVWDLLTGTLRHDLSSKENRWRQANWVNAVACTTVDGWPVAVTGSSTVGVWDLTTGALRGTITGHNGTVRLVACTTMHGRPAVVTTTAEEALRVWDLRTGAPLATVAIGDTWLTALTCTTVDGHPIAVTGDEDAVVRVWDLTTGAVRATLSGHEGEVTAVTCTVLDGVPVAVTASRDRTVRIWDLARAELLTTLSFPSPLRGALRVGPTGEIITGVGWDLVVTGRRLGGHIRQSTPGFGTSW